MISKREVANLPRDRRAASPTAPAADHQPDHDRAATDALDALPAIRFVQRYRKVTRDGLLLHITCGKLTGVVPCSECCNLGS